jgi:3-phenylpropionate/trans-cinnamate dioxygenase ferredoxin reductase subunit
MTSDKREKVVVVGAGHGGGSVVAYLRQYGYAGDIELIGMEPVVPYHRPPLSKAWMKGETSLEALALKPAAFYAAENIALRLGTRVVRIDAARCCVALDDGDELVYDHLVLAPGADARSLSLPGAAFSNVMSLRNLNDAAGLRAALTPGKKLVIIGGGYVGLECAATARALGVEVVLVERAPRLLERVASPAISAFLQSYHQRHGVEIVTAADLLAIDGETRAEGIRLKDGRSFACDALLVGVGANPSVALAQEAGLVCDDGILVDADCRTSQANIFALGDAAKRPHDVYGRTLRLESVPSALEQAKRVASVLTGRAPAAAEVPWFWSDQYDLKLQMAGLLLEATDSVVRGDPDHGKFAVYHLCAGCVVAVEAVNSPQDFMAGKKLIAAKTRVDATRLADTAVALKDLLV